GLFAAAGRGRELPVDQGVDGAGGHGWARAAAPWSANPTQTLPRGKRDPGVAGPPGVSSARIQELPVAALAADVAPPGFAAAHRPLHAAAAAAVGGVVRYGHGQ